MGISTRQPVTTIDAQWLNDPELQRLIAVYDAAGHVLRFVGGCVRDALMGVPTHDIDMAGTATPEQAITLLEAAGFRIIPTGLAHGTVTVLLARGPVQITTLRADKACDGRHAEVKFGTDWAEDARRRDFTCNALYADGKGRLYDTVGGLADIAARRVRFIGNPADRIAEDALRILRFFRFWSRVETDAPDEKAIEAIREAVAKVENLSGERIQQEMLSLLKTPRACDALQIMSNVGLDPLLWGGAVRIERLQRAIAMQALQSVPGEWKEAACIALLLPEAGRAEWLATRWKLSNRLARQIRLLKALALPDQIRRDGLMPLIRQHGAEAMATRLMCHAVEQGREEWLPVASALCSWEVPVFPVNAADLMAQGHTPGPALGERLKQLEQQWEASNYQLDKAALLQQVQSESE